MTAARYWDEKEKRWLFVSQSHPLPVEVEGGGGPATVSWGAVTDKPSTFPPTIGTTAATAKAGNWTPAAADISNATAVGRSVLTATDAAAARTAIGAGTSNQNLSALPAAEATAGTSTTLRAITAAVLAGAIDERTKSKSQIAALTPIADPATADIKDVATLLNSVIAALKA